jgi:hypothetical protein
MASFRAIALLVCALTATATAAKLQATCYFTAPDTYTVRWRAGSPRPTRAGAQVALGKLDPAGAAVAVFGDDLNVTGASRMRGGRLESGQTWALTAPLRLGHAGHQDVGRLRRRGAGACVRVPRSVA